MPPSGTGIAVDEATALLKINKKGTPMQKEGDGLGPALENGPQVPIYATEAAVTRTGLDNTLAKQGQIGSH